MDPVPLASCIRALLEFDSIANPHDLFMLEHSRGGGNGEVFTGEGCFAGVSGFVQNIVASSAYGEVLAGVR